MRHRVALGMLMSLGLMVTACEGGASPAGQSSAGTPVTGPASTPGAGPATATAGSVSGGWGSADIVVGETRTEFAIPVFGCSRQGDEVEGHGDAVDGSGASFRMTFPLAIGDWDSRQAHLIKVTAAGHVWVANGPSTEDLATFAGPKVDTLEISAPSEDPRSYHAIGSFLVVDTSQTPYDEKRTDQVAGTFDITCDPTS
jgi:hypothetical protein